MGFLFCWYLPFFLVKCCWLLDRVMTRVAPVYEFHAERKIIVSIKRDRHGSLQSIDSLFKRIGSTFGQTTNISHHI